MLKTNFDELENSLNITLEEVRRDRLLKQATLASEGRSFEGSLMDQLEDQATLLNMLRDHYNDLTKSSDWPTLEKEAIALLTYHKPFNETQEREFKRLKRELHARIQAVRSQIDEEYNGMIVERGRSHARRSTRVKTFKNWTPI